MDVRVPNLPSRARAHRRTPFAEAVSEVASWDSVLDRFDGRRNEPYSRLVTTRSKIMSGLLPIWIICAPLAFLVIDWLTASKTTSYGADAPIVVRPRPIPATYPPVPPA